ncbi:MAG: hypothetical protein KKH98_03225 [Spirochaetes bacterium]|nr:hypothetical protein [Spirochaetota bacterium]
MKFNLIIIVLLAAGSLSAGINNPDNIQGVEQYGLFYINQKPPEYFEDFYQLYNKRLYYGEDNIRANMRYLFTALRSQFRHPSKALCLLKNEQEEKKYKALLTMHVYVKIMQNYLTLGSLYDKRYIYHFNMPFKEDLKKSLQYAKFYYTKAKQYWQKVLKYAGDASGYKERISIAYLEDELYFILNRNEEVDWDYEYTFNLHLSHLEKNLRKLDSP